VATERSPDEREGVHQNWYRHELVDIYSHGQLYKKTFARMWWSTNWQKNSGTTGISTLSGCCNVGLQSNIAGICLTTCISCNSAYQSLTPDQLVSTLNLMSKLRLVSYLAPNMFWFYSAVGAYQSVLGVETDIVQSQCDPVSDPVMLQDQLDIAFICGLPFTALSFISGQLKALVAPVMQQAAIKTARFTSPISSSTLTVASKP